ncbi:cytochrome P450 [Pisolithus orientalis]|uniref:cytochrome P450 n=1 Tax=Pisolithus orientalis TaxID=936130 RepID=UPI002224571D|nr:cytochrome P450 [Pisolithus orientalis]KAI6001685.1 cytochrome P450 [Pisolithus orientalis]
MIFVTVIALYLTYRLYRFLHGLHKTSYLPGIRPLFDPTVPPGNFIPTCWFNYGFLWTWVFRKTEQFRPNYEVLSSVPILSGTPFYYLRSVEVVRQFLGNEIKNQIAKPDSFTTARLWGHSVASQHGEDWKRHRRAVVPAFNQTMFSRVAEETVAVYNDLVTSQGWSSATRDVIVHIDPLIIRFTFVILSRCGFGIPISWKTNEDDSDDAIFEKALATASETFIPRISIPNWLYALPIRALQEIDNAWNTVVILMRKFAQARRSDLAGFNEDGDRTRDVFTRLVLAADEVGKHALDISEVAPNMLTLLFAGHETTMSSLITTLMMLALWQDEQEKAHEEIVREFPKGTLLTTNVCKGLKYVTACVMESNRLIPATVYLGRATTTTEIHITIRRPRPETIVIPKDAMVVIDQFSILHNPIDFPAPDVYNPSRFLDEVDSDMPMTIFGTGPRACLGRKFAMTEMVCFIALFLRDWKVDVVPEDLVNVEREALKGSRTQATGTKMSEKEKRERLQERLMSDAMLRGTTFALGKVRLCVSARH